MVRFEEKKIIIEIDDPFPVDSWLVLMGGLCKMARFTTQDNICDNTFHAVIDFIGQLMPDFDTAKKMMK
ncbi:MAG: hypothetical protein LBH92_03945 [Bacteroidales bacterium]|jgi:hypothetical protein|nr:hypothetical protein [Bacteroidales bacterium]